MSTNTFINSMSPAQGVSTTVPAAEELRDIKGFYAIEIPMWLQISLLVIAIAYLAYFIYMRYIKRKLEADLTIYQLTVKRLKELDLSKNSNDFYLAYSEYIRIYLEQRLSMHALDKTADEMRQILIKERRIQTNQAMFLSKIFQRADLAKFALYTVPMDTKAKDIELTLEIIRSIEDTVLVEEARALNSANFQLEETSSVTDDTQEVAL